MPAEPYPYSLPIWRGAHRSTSPDARLVAEIPHAYETTMSNPTMGTLQVSDGLSLEKCNPSFIWSQNSRYLAVPQWNYTFGVFWGQRILVVDTCDRVVFASRRYLDWLQPESFGGEVLEVLKNPTGRSRRIAWSIPQDLRRFKRLSIRW